MADMEVEDISFVKEINEVREMLSSQDEPITKSLELISSSISTGIEHSQSFQNKQLSKLFVVVDTNVFIRDVRFLDRLKEKPVLSYSCPVIVIPWVVVQELDCLKDGRRNSSNGRQQPGLQEKAKSAVSVLSRWLNSRHTCVIGQTPKEPPPNSMILLKNGQITCVASHKPPNYIQTSAVNFIQTDLAESFITQILSASGQLFLQNKVEGYSVQNANGHVTLLTLDRNLSNKAKIMAIDTHSIVSLQEWLGTQIQASSIPVKAAGAIEAFPIKATRRKIPCTTTSSSCSAAGKCTENSHEAKNTDIVTKTTACCDKKQLLSNLKSDEIIITNPVRGFSNIETTVSGLRGPKFVKLSTPISRKSVKLSSVSPKRRDLASLKKRVAEQWKPSSVPPVKSSMKTSAESKSRPVLITVTEGQLEAVLTKDQSKIFNNGSSASKINRKPESANQHANKASSSSSVPSRVEPLIKPGTVYVRQPTTVPRVKSVTKPAAVSETVASSSSVAQNFSKDAQVVPLLSIKVVHGSMKRSLSDAFLLSSAPPQKRLASSTDNVATSKSPSLSSKSQLRANSKQSPNAKAVDVVQDCKMNSSKCSKNLKEEGIDRILNCLKQGLSTIIVTEMESIYGDIWLDVVLRKPPWTFHHVLECLQKHWIAVFGGDVWPRNIQNTVRELMTNTNSLPINKLIMLSKLLVSSINETVGSGSEERNYSSTRTEMLSELEQIETFYLQTEDTGVKSTILSGSDFKMVCDTPPSSSTFQLTLQRDISMQNAHRVLAEDRRFCIQQVFQTVWEGILNLQNLLFGALSSAFNETRIAVLDKLLQFLQSVALINNAYTSALQPAASENDYHQLRAALNGTAQFNSFQIESFTSDELRLFFQDDKNRLMLNTGLEQLHTLMNSMSCAADNLLTPAEIQIIQSNL